MYEYPGYGKYRFKFVLSYNTLFYYGSYFCYYYMFIFRLKMETKEKLKTSPTNRTFCFIYMSLFNIVKAFFT